MESKTANKMEEKLKLFKEKKRSSMHEKRTTMPQKMKKKPFEDVSQKAISRKASLPESSGDKKKGRSVLGATQFPRQTQNALANDSKALNAGKKLSATNNNKKENSNTKQLSMREKLEEWRKEKGKEKADSGNPLLSRKRPLVTVERKKVITKKRKTKEGKQYDEVGKTVVELDEIRAIDKGRDGATTTTDSCHGRGEEKAVVDQGTSERDENSVTKATDVPLDTLGLGSDKTVSGGLNPERAMEAIEEEVEEEEVEDHVTDGCQEDRNSETSAGGEIPEGKFTKSPPIGKDPSESNSTETGERIASFSHFSFGTPSKRQVGFASKTPQTTDRRRTMCITPSARLSSQRPDVNAKTPRDNSRHSASFVTPGLDRAKRPQGALTPFRNGVKRFPPNSVLHSAPSRPSAASIRGSKLLETPDICKSSANEKRDELGKEKMTTPFYRRMSHLPASSVLRAAPVRAAVSSTGTAGIPQLPSTPSMSQSSRLQSRGILKSAPPRRSTSVLLKGSISTKKISKAVGDKADGKRRNTIHFSREEEVCTPVAPFTPRGQWQNKNLSVRERLDIWLEAKGNTVKKPFVVQKTPKRRKTSSPPHDACLNTTFTLDASGDPVVDDDVINVGARIPKMNDIEESIVEEALQQIIARLGQPSEQDAVKAELDLILSTSPGVVRLASFWIIRARLAAESGDVERVICLLEQANAFDAQPQYVIRDEICKYLEKLKSEELDNPDRRQDTASDSRSDALNNEEARTRTPAKRVKFVDSQQHVVFKSSLIKFCLLESTPFRKKLKSTLARRVLTPVRRSGRIEKVESRLSSVVRGHSRTFASPRDLESDIRDGEVFFMPNPNVDTKWNTLWGVEDVAENDEKELSFC